MSVLRRVVKELEGMNVLEKIFEEMDEQLRIIKVFQIVKMVILWMERSVMKMEECKVGMKN